MVATAAAPKKSTKNAAQAAQPAAAEAPAEAQSSEAQDPEAPIYVRATRIGHYDNARHYPVGYDHPRAGFVFVLQSRDGASKVGPRQVPVHLTAAEQFSERWMERVSNEDGRDAMAMQSRRPMQKNIIKKAAADRSVI